MRDTSTLFKLCVKALLELKDEDRALIAELAGVLTLGGPLRLVVPTNEHTPVAQELMRKGRTPHQQELDRQTKEVGKQAAKRTREKNMRKRKVKVKGQFDPAKVLAAAAGKVQDPPHAGARVPKTGGVRAQVLDILRQSTGALSPKEIGELIGAKAGKVSATLCDLYLRAKHKGLSRTAGKNDHRAVYLYTLTEAK